ncbi:unnamed protein product [Arabidopsis arenosa]|uniref:Origin recognition complex subunit 2 n=1 Tax=Arabidopsis arenosa TaxID=38785 RepID=A0A8S2ASS8_ARAAE|nr:unnamed protein product [Arabidopsis arenosa]
MWRRIISSHLKTLAADVVADSPRGLTVLCGGLAFKIEISGSAFSDLNSEWSLGFGLCTANQKRLGQMNGVDAVLEGVAMNKSQDPKTPGEEEMLANLFDCLCCLLMPLENKERFVNAEGVELMIIIMKQKKYAYGSAIRALDFAMTNYPPACQRFVDVMGLKTAFAAFMAGILRGSRRDRLLSKFVENEFEKIDWLMELYMRYSDRVRLEAERLDQLELDDLEVILSNVFSEKLQLVAVILGHIWNGINCFGEGACMWLQELKWYGFGLLIYGFGSKKALIEEFASASLTEYSVVVINGYLLSVLLALIDIMSELLTCKRKSSRSLSKGQVTFLSRSMDDILSFLHGPQFEDKDYFICVVVHNIDGPALRDPESQQTLARLASYSHKRMVVSIDRGNAPLYILYCFFDLRQCFLYLLAVRDKKMVDNKISLTNSPGGQCPETESINLNVLSCLFMKGICDVLRHETFMIRV